jgi:hypothetical protein
LLDLILLEFLDERRTEKQANDQRGKDGSAGSESNVAEYVEDDEILG